jgi:hypothetical protein
MMKVHDDFEQMGDLDGSPLRVGGGGTTGGV